MDDLRDLAAAYAMDALDPDERAAFEAYMADRPDVQAEVAELRDAAGLLAADAATEPPPGMRAAVLDTIADLPQEGPTPGDVVEFPGTPRRAVWLLAAAAVVAMVVSVAGVLALTRGPTVGDVLAASDAVPVVLDGDGLEATFTFSRDLDAGVFESVLPDVGLEQTYELWLIADGVPEPAGLFRPGVGGVAEVLIEADFVAGASLGLTVEPAGGSPAPTGEILLLAALP